MPAAGITPHRPQSIDYDRDDRATVAVFASVLAAVIAFLSYGAVLRFSFSVLHVVVPLGLSLFVSVSPFVAWRVSARGHYDEPEPWWRSQPTLTIAAAVITALAGILDGSSGLSLLTFVAVIGLVSSLVAIVLWIVRGTLLSSLTFLGGSAAFGVWVSGVLLNRRRAAGGSLPAIDTLLYSPGLSVIAIPLFFTAILLLAVELKKSWNTWPNEAERPLRTDYAAWVFLVVVSIGVIPTSSLDALGIGNRNAMISGSSAMAVSVSLLTMATAVAWWRRKRTSTSVGDFVFLLAFVPLVLVSIGVMSPYLMLLLVVAGVVIGFLGRLLRDLLIAGSTLVCLAATVATWKLVLIANRGRGAVLDSVVSLDGVWWPYFLLLNLFWTWVYIYLRLRDEKLETVGAIRGAALEGRISDVVVVAIVSVVAIGGWLTVASSGIGGAFATSVSDFSRWLALSLLMASAWRWLVQWRKQKEDSAPEGGLVGSIRISQLWIAALAIPVSVTILLNFLRATLALRP